MNGILWKMKHRWCRS